LPIIDMHTHVYPDRLAATAVDAVCRACGIAPCFDGTADGLSSLMRRAGVARSVIQPVASKASQVRSINDWLATLADDRIIPFGAMHPDLPDPEAEMERLVALGLPGFKLHPEYQGFCPDEERLDPLFAAAARHGLIACFHAGEDIGLPDVHSTPGAFARLLSRHPDLTVVLAHMGGWRQWDDVLRHLAGREVYLDTSFTLPYLGEARFAELVTAHGAHRVLFGSDAPWGDLVRDVALLKAMPFSPHDLEAILWRNAARLLLSSEEALASE
jgi:predicted TIM-barrel fold metal-dependent hydrolase